PTTASASKRSILSVSSWFSSACTTRACIPAPASAWRSVRKWSTATAGASGSNRRPARAAVLCSRYRQREAIFMAERKPGAPVEILLVEDNPADVRLTQEALKEGKVYNNLHWAKDGVEALEFLHRQGKYAGAPRPDIILLDLNLPKKDGREVLQDIKND